jgi:hypothetical protein
MHTTFDRTKWVENDLAEQQRDHVNRETTPATARALYPFKARARKRLVAYGLAEGQVFRYARCRLTPQFYPIEVMIGIADDTAGTHPRRLYGSSDEIELLEV